VVSATDPHDRILGFLDPESGTNSDYTFYGNISTIKWY
jgi:hypothetical protein